MTYAKENLQRMNDYDFNKMVEHFQLKEALTQERRKRFKKLIEVNKQYLSKVDTMRDTIKNEDRDAMRDMMRLSSARRKTFNEGETLI